MIDTLKVIALTREMSSSNFSTRCASDRFS